MEFAGRYRDVNCMLRQYLLNQREAMLLGVDVGEQD
jgi:hypothetical protein